MFNGGLPVIPFNKPYATGKELSYIRQAFENGHVSGDGPFSKKCQQILEETCGVLKALLTSSGTDALEMSALLLDLQPGDEVILPSFTFPSTANAFVLFGATPVFSDVQSETLNLDPALLEGKISAKTKAIVPVHYAGIACEMDPILELAAQHRLAVIEDNAHGIFGKYRGRSLGSLGSCAALSFHETKNISCGEGGALLLSDADKIPRAEILREKGTDRSRFFRGEVEKYTWVDKGSSYLPSEISAAVLLAQLEARDEIQEKRKSVWRYYQETLKSWASRFDVGLPFVPADCEPSYHLFYLMMPSSQAKDRLEGHLKKNGILAIPHYQPLHLSKMGQKFGGREGDCPVAEQASRCLLRLPFYNDLTKESLQRIAEEVTSFQA